MSFSRRSVILSILRGFLCACAFTLTGMLLIAALAVFARISDGLLTVLNQFLKISAIILGTCLAVGRGGQRGFATGAALALLYTIVGYALCIALGGVTHDTVIMLGEILLGCTIGALTGAILANLKPYRRKTRQ